MTEYSLEFIYVLATLGSCLSFFVDRRYEAGFFFWVLAWAAWYRWSPIEEKKPVNGKGK